MFLQRGGEMASRIFQHAEYKRNKRIAQSYQIPHLSIFFIFIRGAGANKSNGILHYAKHKYGKYLWQW